MKFSAVDGARAATVEKVASQLEPDISKMSDQSDNSSDHMTSACPGDAGTFTRCRHPFPSTQGLIDRAHLIDRARNYQSLACLASPLPSFLACPASSLARLLCFPPCSPASLLACSLAD